MSVRSRLGADPGALSRAAGVTYEMARRYLHGNAKPNEPTRRAIEDWLQIPHGYLDGVVGMEKGSPPAGAPGGGPVDTDTLRQCLEAVLVAQGATGADLAPDKVARLVSWVYEDAQAGRAPDADRIRQLIAVFQ